MAAQRQELLNKDFVRTVNDPGYYTDGSKYRGFALDVHQLKNGDVSKTYKQRLTIKGQGKNGRDLKTTRSIGGEKDISLRKARKIAKRWKKLAESGIDPKERERKIPTFAVVSRSVLNRDSETRSDQYSAEVERWLTTWVYPHIGAKCPDKITQDELYYILTPLSKRVPTTAKRLISQLITIFDRCETRGYIRSNPITRGFIADLPKEIGETQHHPALPHTMLPDAMDRIGQAILTDISTRLCLKAVILTGLRLSAARLGEWTEFYWKDINTDADWNKGGWDPVNWDDLESGRNKVIVWVIPAERMKGQKGLRKKHRVPVSTGLMEILLQMRAIIAKEGRAPRFIFPKRSENVPVFRSAVSAFCRHLKMPSDTEGKHATVHGFRSTIRDWCAESKVPFEVAETVLAHEMPKVVRAYLRTDILNERARLMQAWADNAAGTLPDDWKWSEPDNETAALIAELRQDRMNAEKRAEEADRRTEAAEKRVDEMLVKLSGMQKSLDALAERFSPAA